MKKRNSVTLIRSLLLLGALLVLMGGAAALTAQASDSSKAKEDTMATAEKTEAPAIPPIDAVTPANFQTASFGLG